ncbi:hypothetical protein [Bryocella elongata]|nr:hypothetical protein [Bryocella elongata]
MLIDNGVQVVTHHLEERREDDLLSRLWELMKPNDVAIGGTAIDARWTLLLHRSWMRRFPSLDISILNVEADSRSGAGEDLPADDSGKSRVNVPLGPSANEVIRLHQLALNAIDRV